MKAWLQHPTVLVLLIVLGLLIACLLIVTAVLLLLRSRKEEKEESAEETAPPAEPRVFSTQWQLICDSFQRAIERLRDKTPGRDYQYAVPWYLLLGESGSGKSAIADALSGARTEWVQSPGETSEPRWLLFDQAVLVDVPGDVFLSRDEIERSGKRMLPAFLDWRAGGTAWHRFLQLTARFRPRQPLNGIVLTISVLELLDAIQAPDHSARMARLAHLGRRLNEVQGVTGLSVPVYVIVTHCEALDGFSSYTQALSEYSASRTSQRNGNFGEMGDDIFGWSNPYSLEHNYDSGWVEEAFHATSEVLLHRQLEILAACKTQKQAEGVLLFPFGIQQLREPLQVLIDLVFASTAYQSAHTLRGIYFSGRPWESEAAVPAPAVHGRMLTGSVAELTRKPSSSVLFVRNLFENKIFGEQFLSVAVSRRLFRGNRSVLTAQIVGAALIFVLLIGLARSWARISHIQSNTLDPVLTSVGQSLQKLPAGSAGNVRPAVDLLNSVGLVENVGYTSLAMPYSFFDTLHRDLDRAVEGVIGHVLIGSCKRALENRIAAVMSPPVVPVVVTGQTYPPGAAWKADPSYAALDRYLTDVRQLDNNIDRYGAISSAGFGTFAQLNDLLRYLGGRGLPDTSRYAHDPHYTQLLQNASWDPVTMSPGYDSVTAENASKLIQSFYTSWFNSNPLKNEVDQLTGPDGLQVFASFQLPTNGQLRALMNQALSIDNQLNDGSYDWLAATFNRQSYPAVGAHLDHMPFANSQFTNAVEINGERELAGLQLQLQQSGVLSMTDGRVRLDGKVRALASVLNALFQYDLMANEEEKSSGCSLLTSGSTWDQNDLSKAIQIEATREKIEGDLLPSLPGNYRVQVKAIVDDRASNAIYAALKSAAVAESAGASERSLDADLENFDQSVQKLKEIDSSLSNLRASANVSCLNRAMINQARSLLTKVNQQATALYLHGTAGDEGSSGVPTSEWLFGVSSPEELQAYLASERQSVIALSTQATPLVNLLRSKGGSSSDVLAKWQKISHDVEALQSKKLGSPIQLLESFITNDLDKITPQSSCKAPAIANSPDEFLNLRSDLSRVAVDRCERLSIRRFNQIAGAFNAHLAGKFPFSQALDTRPGAEAAPDDIAGFYQIYDENSDGLAGALAGTSSDSSQFSSFLRNMAEARPLVSGIGKITTPAVGIQVQFRTNRNREVLGNRIAEWTFTIGQKTVDSATLSADTPPLLWQFGDPVTLSLRYAYDSPEVPSAANPSRFARVQGRTVTYRYSDPWALLSFLQDHPSDLPGVSNQYAVRIPNRFADANGQMQPQQTTVYMQVQILPVGAKEGTAPIAMPAFPVSAPRATSKAGHGL